MRAYRRFIRAATGIFILPTPRVRAHRFPGINEVGTPTAPTATAGTSTTQLATTAFVGAARLTGSVIPPAAAAPLMDGAALVGVATSNMPSEDHVHPTDTTRAPLASPTFTGDPEGPDRRTRRQRHQHCYGPRLSRRRFPGVAVAPPARRCCDASLIESGAGAVGTSAKYAREGITFYPALAAGVSRSADKRCSITHGPVRAGMAFGKC